MNTVRLGSKRVGEGRPVYVIAEMACSHDGRPDKALRLVEAARGTGADAVQLQFFFAEHLVTPDHSIRPVLESIQFDPGRWREIFAAARETGLDVLACCFDVPSAELALELGADGIKLNSSDLSNPDLLGLVAASKTPFTMGTGASTVEEVAVALARAEACGAEDVVLMHGVQNFPTRLDDAHIRRVRLLWEVFPYPVGYADHTDADLEFAPWADLLALGAGACVLEKHYTLDRSEKGVDHEAALEPDEFARYVRRIRTAESALGPERFKPLSESDRTYRRFQKKSVVAARDIRSGEILTRDMVAFLRTGGDPGVAPADAASLLGRRAGRDLARYEPVLRADVEEDA